MVDSGLAPKERSFWFCVCGLSGASFNRVPWGWALRWVGQYTSAQSAGVLRNLGGIGAPARFALAAALLISLTLAISACGRDQGASLGERIIPLGQPVPKGGGRYQVGEPYQVAGIWYRPRVEPNYDRTGRASWYGELFQGRRTANGEIYDMDRLTAAHPTLPLPVYAQVTNLNNGRTIVVRINDRGPFARDRIIDLSRRSADVLGFRRRGTAPVRVKYLRRAPLSGDDSYERKYLASRGLRNFAAKPKPKAGGRTIGARLAVASLPAASLPPLPDRVVRATAAQSAPPADALARDELAMLVWRTQIEASPEPTGSTGLPHRAEPRRPSPPNGPAVQAGSFKIRANAERARETLSTIATVKMTEIDIGGQVYFRVRVGPFEDEIDAAVALHRVRAAGYRGAKIVMRN